MDNYQFDELRRLLTVVVGQLDEIRAAAKGEETPKESQEQEPEQAEAQGE